MASAVTPVQKVIQMMQEMHSKGEKSKEEEMKIYEEYSEWVDDQIRDKGYEMQTLKDTVAKMNAEIQKADADGNALSTQIKGLQNDIAGWERQAQGATEIREAGKAEYERVNKDYSESIDALERAKNTLQSHAFDRDQAAELLQTLVIVPEAHKALSAFLQNKHDITQGAPAVAGYEFQSGGIIKMLTDLQKKFKGEFSDLNKEEANAAHAYDMEVLNLRDQIKNATDLLNEKVGERASRKTDAGEYRAQLADAENVLAETQKYVRTVKTTFEIKTRDYKVNQDVRAEELVALTKAIEIMSGNSVSGHADKHLPAMVQKSFLQTQTFLQTSKDPHHQEVAKFLEDKAHSSNSKVLQVAALQISAGGPFDKIAKIIQDLITRLETEAAEEADHHGFCNEELKQNKLTREAKERKSEELNTKITKLTAHINKLAEEIAQSNKEVADLQKAMTKYTGERAEEKKVNEQTIADAKEAQVAISSALQVLKDFYEKSGGEAFIQTGDKQVPEMASYGGQQNSKTGVVGMIEVIQSDFARLQADTESAESQSAKEYEDYMKTAKEDSEMKHKDSFDKGMLKDRKEHERKLTKKDLRSTTKELNASNEYYEQLKPQCLEVHVSHEERMRLRQEEIESLQQAYEILDAKK